MRRLVHKSRRLVLRPLRLRDHATWVAAYARGLPAQNEWDQAPLPEEKCSLKEYQKILARHRQRAREDKCYIYGVFHHRTLVGMIDIAVYERGVIQFANFGYRLFNRYWDRGFGREAALAGLKIGLHTLKLQRLEASIDLHNKRSIKLVRAIGMRREGIKRAYWFQEGRWDDQMIYVANPGDVRLK